MSTTKPVLWHIAVSHYSEKARWALDWKGVEHELRAPPPGAHIGFALILTRGREATFPILQLDGRNVAGSDAILAALDRSHPERPLLPEDPVEARRALELQSYFDSELGVAARHVAMHAMRSDREAREAFVATSFPVGAADVAAVRRAGGAFANVFFRARYGVADEADAERAHEGVLAAYDRLESELDRGDGAHLVGDRFSLADLAAASLFVPVVAPVEGPDLPPPPAGLARLRESLRERPGSRWVRETFARYRRPVLPAA